MIKEGSKSIDYPEHEVSLGLTEKQLEALRKQLFFYAKRIIGSHPNIDHEAENVVQETLVKAHENYHSFRKESSLQTWLFRIAQNVVKDIHRKTHKTSEKPDRNIFASEDFTKPETDEEISQRAPNNHSDMKLHNKLLSEKLLATLSQEDRSLLTLKEIEGHSVEELSKLLGLNENTIKVKLFRIKQKLRKKANKLKLL